MAKQKRSIYVSDEAWARLEYAARADDRSASAYLERALMKLPAPNGTTAVTVPEAPNGNVSSFRDKLKAVQKR